MALALVGLLLSSVARGQSSRPTVDERPDDALGGKIFVGYQGWFAAPGDGGGTGWIHWGPGGKFEPGAATVDLWPDITDFADGGSYPTPFRHADGSVARVFSSLDFATVDRHFAWMQQYGIDGAFLQRFGVSVKDEGFGGIATRCWRTWKGPPRHAAGHGP